MINASTFLFSAFPSSLAFSFFSSPSLSLLLMDLKHDVVYYETEKKAEMLRRRKNDLFNFNVEFSQLRCFNVVK